MRLQQHALAAVPLAASVYLGSHSWSAAFLAASSSVLIDVDHVADYVSFRRGWLGIEDFFTTCNNSLVEKTHVIFHAWEWIVLFWILQAAGALPHWLWPVGVGVSYHVVSDHIANPVTGSFYFIACRAWHGFRFAPFFKENGKNRGEWAIPAWYWDLRGLLSGIFQRDRGKQPGHETVLAEVPLSDPRPNRKG